MTHVDIPRRANRALHVILFIFFLILIRIWYLTVIQYDLYYELAKKPQKKTTIQKPARGTIRDRFNIPYAVNKISYQVALIYDPIKQIPRIRWQKGPKGKKEKVYPRKQYIESLSEMLAKELNLNAFDIEDILYSQASLFPNTPFVIQDEISETTYYKLKSLERKYLGLLARSVPKRFYPKGSSCGDIIGFTGIIDSCSYLNTQSEIQELEEFLIAHESGRPIFLPKGFTSVTDIKNRILELKAKAYKMNDTIGKVGVEKQFDDDLRGFRGKQIYEVDTKGHYVRMLPGSKSAIPGKKLVLNISSELQEYAEKLLAENEHIRDKRFPNFGKDHRFLPTPWIKGGSIVALNPKTGEILALASYPRMDPNDFIQTQNEIVSESKRERIQTWLEGKAHLANIWDGKVPMKREIYDPRKKQFIEEARWLTLDQFIDMIFSKQSDAKTSFYKLFDVKGSLEFQHNLLTLLDLSEQPNMHVVIDTLYPKEKGYIATCFASSEKEIQHVKEAFSQHKELVSTSKDRLDRLFGTIKYNDDKLLLLDVAMLVIKENNIPDALLPHIESTSLSAYRKQNQACCILLSKLKEHVKNTYHIHDFQEWRNEHFADYLKQKRKEEKERKTYQRPYLEYLTKLEKKMFHEFFEDNKYRLLLHFLQNEEELPEDLSCHLEPLLKEGSSFLLSLRDKEAYETLQKAVLSIPSDHRTEYLTSMRSYRDLNDKLYGYYSQIKKKKTKQLAMDLASSFYPYTKFGYGRSYAYRQSTPLGSIFKVITAYEAIRQNYERGFYENRSSLNPLTIIDEIHPHMQTSQGIVLGFHEDGRKITRRYKGGTLPRSHASLGKIDYYRALERSSNIYFSLLASDVIEDPNDLVTTSLKFGFGNKTGVDLPGEISGVLPKDLDKNRSGLYAFAIGQHSLIATPLQTSIMLSSLVNEGEVLKPQILRCKAGRGREHRLFEKKDQTYPYEDLLNRLGIFFPFFIETQKDEEEHKVTFYDKTLYRRITLPKDVKDYLLQSLHNVVSAPTGAARAAVIRYLYGNQAAKRAYLKLKYQLAGKTSTAEVAYKPTLDRQMPPIKSTDIWFGGISFQPSEQKGEEEPELAVVVYLKFGDYGKEAAPLAGEIVSKWRSIQKKHELDETNSP